MIINRWCQDEEDAPGCLCRFSHSKISLVDTFGSVTGTRTLGNTCTSSVIFEAFTPDPTCPTSRPTPAPTDDCYTSARKVRIESTTGQQIQMFELRVISSSEINVALNKQATQSSTLRQKFVASNAVDGNSLTFSHTDDADAYFEVDLNDTFDLENVVIVNRWCNDATDPNGCMCRLSNANLKLLDANDLVLENRTFGNTCNKTIVSESFIKCPH